MRYERLLRSHVTEQFDHPGMREKIVREIGDIYKGNIFFGEDKMQIPFAAPGPSKLD